MSVLWRNFCQSKGLRGTLWTPRNPCTSFLATRKKTTFKEVWIVANMTLSLRNPYNPGLAFVEVKTQAGPSTWNATGSGPCRTPPQPPAQRFNLSKEIDGDLGFKKFVTPLMGCPGREWIRSVITIKCGKDAKKGKAGISQKSSVRFPTRKDKKYFDAR